MKPSIGRTVHYRLTKDQCEQIRKRRRDAARKAAGQAESGYVVHTGNDSDPGDVVPLVIVRTWGGPDELVNGQAMLDGNDTLWVTSARYSEAGDNGAWSWPERTDS